MLAALRRGADRLKSLELNVRLYPWFRAAADGHAWITVFFYMNQYLPLFAFSGRIQRELKFGEVRT